jgi:predicted Zn-dependent peptidase
MFQKSVLENGLRVVTESIPGARSISIGVLVAASPRDEGEKQHGIAHLVEHMMFQGTSSRDSLEIARLIDSSGGHMGAFTSRDYTFFQFTVLDDYSTFALDLLGDVLLYSTFPEDDLENEKRVVIREIASGVDDPADRAHTIMKQTAWADHPLGRNVAGDEATVATFTREDVIYFVHDHYLPNRMIVSAAGNVEHVEFLSQVRDALWRIIGESAMPQLDRPTFTSGITVENSSVSQVYFCIGFEAGEHSSEDRYNTYVLNEILGASYSSRLFKNIREQRGLVYNIGSEYHSYFEGGMLVIEGVTAPEYFMDTLSLTLYEALQLFAGIAPVEADEVVRGRVQMNGKHLIAGENSNTRMGALASQEFYFGRHISTEEIEAGFNAVTVETLTELCERVFLPAFFKPSIAVVGPESPDHYSKKMIEEALEQFAEMAPSE